MNMTQSDPQKTPTLIGKAKTNSELRLSTINNEAWTKCYGNTDKETIHSQCRKVGDESGIVG